MSMFNPKSVEREIAGRRLKLETGKMGRQASSCTVTYGDSVVFVAAVAGPVKNMGFFPLTVDYREKTYASGKIPGGFFKREGQPTTKEKLTARLIDRPIRPLFPEGYMNEISVSCMVLSADPEVDCDIAAMIGAFTALELSSIPFQGPLGACRMGYVDGKVVPMASYLDTDTGALDLIVAASEDAILMVEGGANEVSEEVMIEAILQGQTICSEIISMQQELCEMVGVTKSEFEAPEKNIALLDKLRDGYVEELRGANFTQGKLIRKDAIKAVRDKAIADMTEGLDDDQAAKDLSDEIKVGFEDLRREVIRSGILEGRRSDDRKSSEIRQIECEVSVLPRVHGASLYTRGESQALVVLTLGSQYDQQRLDGLREASTKKFMLHYNFPSFSVGESWPNRGPKRREIGHGALAERAITPMLPDFEKFPYTIRSVSEIMESNGSSSMATVCGTTLALMDAGAPIKRPVAGIAMGLVKEGDKVAILTDIAGDEDHFGDMDFKVAGTQNGITALQMDIKMKGLDREILVQALDQAKDARMSVLRSMLAVLPRPRSTVSAHSPRIVHVPIGAEKIGNLIGPGGRTIRKLQEETGTKIDINDAEGYVTVGAWGPSNLEEAVRIVRALTEEIEVGRVYRGRVVSVKDFGCFVEILPGQEGLLHISEMSNEYVSSVADEVTEGEQLEVAVVGIDPQGRVRLSRKPLLEPANAAVGSDDDSADSADSDN